MKKIILSTLIGTICSMSILSAHAETSPAVDFSKLTVQQQDAIGKVASDYIVKHPEVLIQASQALQAKQQQQQEKDMKDASTSAVALKSQLLNDQDYPSVGPKDAKIAMVVFTDYNCIYCSKSSPDVAALVKEHPEVKFVFKELPIFASKFPTSLYAAQLGFQVFKEKGSDAYLQYHEGVFGTGLNEGKLTIAAVDAVAKKVGVTPNVASDYAKKQIQDDMVLSEKLKIKGTPGFVLMRTDNSKPESTVVIPGYVGKDQFEAIIKGLGSIK